MPVIFSPPVFLRALQSRGVAWMQFCPERIKNSVFNFDEANL